MRSLKMSEIAIRQPNCRVLPPFTVTSMSHNPAHETTFRHPAYSSESNKNVLFILKAYDHPEGGLHHETARVACGMVAGNVWSGYFAYSAGGEPITMGPNGILRVGRNCFFHVPDLRGLAEGKDHLSSLSSQSRKEPKILPGAYTGLP